MEVTYIYIVCASVVNIEVSGCNAFKRIVHIADYPVEILNKRTGGIGKDAGLVFGSYLGNRACKISL